MALMTAAKVRDIASAKDPKEAIMAGVGSYLDDIELFFNWILVGVYIRPDKTAGGIIRPDSNVEEDCWQGKVGLVLKKGPDAFKDDDRTDFGGQSVEAGEWVSFNINDTRAVTINGVFCRVIQDTKICMKLRKPIAVF